MKKYSFFVYFLFGFVLIYFFYLALTITPLQVNESDSLNYHIPLAQNFTVGNFTNLKNISQGLGFYPGVGEIILAVFIILRIPLGFYNVLALIILFWVAKITAVKIGLDKSQSLIFALGVCLLPATIRLIQDQRVDIWLAMFFLASLNLLFKVENRAFYFFKLGCCLGLLVGAKYSGILLAAALVVIFFSRRLISFKIFYAVIPLLIFGFSWYVRNYLVIGNPFYPLHFLGFAGDVDYTTQLWTGFKVLITGKNGIMLIIQAFISEFLIWSIVPLYLLYLCVVRKNRFNSLFVKLILLATFSFAVFLFEPSWLSIQATQSNMRYLLPGVIVFILSVFLIFKSLGNSDKLAIIAVLSSLGVLPLLNYFPKLTIVSLIGLIGLYKIYENISSYHSSK